MANANDILRRNLYCQKWTPYKAGGLYPKPTRAKEDRDIMASKLFTRSCLVAIR